MAECYYIKTYPGEITNLLSLISVHITRELKFHLGVISVRNSNKKLSGKKKQKNGTNADVADKHFLSLYMIYLKM